MYIFRDELLFFGLLIGLTEFIMARIMILRNFPSSFWGDQFSWKFDPCVHHESLSSDLKNTCFHCCFNLNFKAYPAIRVVIQCPTILFKYNFSCCNHKYLAHERAYTSHTHTHAQKFLNRLNSLKIF